MKIIKKLFTLCLVLLILFSAMPVQTSAAKVLYSGTCGKNVKWSLDSDGIMTISGSGAMTDYTSLGGRKIAPWNNYPKFPH